MDGSRLCTTIYFIYLGHTSQLQDCPTVHLGSFTATVCSTNNKGTVIIILVQHGNSHFTDITLRVTTTKYGMDCTTSYIHLSLTKAIFPSQPLCWRIISFRFCIIGMETNVCSRVIITITITTSKHLSNFISAINDHACCWSRGCITTTIDSLNTSLSTTIDNHVGMHMIGFCCICSICSYGVVFGLVTTAIHRLYIVSACGFISDGTASTLLSSMHVYQHFTLWCTIDVVTAEDVCNNAAFSTDWSRLNSSISIVCGCSVKIHQHITIDQSCHI